MTASQPLASREPGLDLVPVLDGVLTQEPAKEHFMLGVAVEEMREVDEAALEVLDLDAVSRDFLDHALRLFLLRADRADDRSLAVPAQNNQIALAVFLVLLADLSKEIVDAEEPAGQVRQSGTGFLKC